MIPLSVLAQLQNHHLAGRCIALVGHGINGHQNVGLGEVSGGATDWNIEADDDEFLRHTLHTTVEIV